MPSHYKYKETHISVEMALRHKIGVPDNTGIYHISVFRHTATWPSHSKQGLVSCNTLRVSDDDMHSPCREVCQSFLGLS